MNTKEVKAQMLRVDAIRVLAETQFKNIEAIYYDTSEVLVEGKTIPIDLAGLNKKMKEVLNQQESDRLYMSIQTLCDAKSQEAKNYINGSKVTIGQLARYEEKYQMAKDFKVSGSYKEQLQLEADLAGLTVAVLADLIVVKGGDYRQSLIAFNARIEAFRIKVKGLVDGGYIDKADKALELAKGFNHLTTDVDIKALFKGL